MDHSYDVVTELLELHPDQMANYLSAYTHVRQCKSVCASLMESLVQRWPRRAWSTEDRASLSQAFSTIRVPESLAKLVFESSPDDALDSIWARCAVASAVGATLSALAFVESQADRLSAPGVLEAALLAASTADARVRSAIDDLVLSVASLAGDRLHEHEIRSHLDALILARRSGK